jgi:hypothetical protein
MPSDDAATARIQGELSGLFSPTILLALKIAAESLTI